MKKLLIFIIALGCSKAENIIVGECIQFGLVTELDLADYNILKINQFIILGDDFYLLQRDLKTISKINLKDNSHYSYSKTGVGPGEMSDPLKMEINDDHVFVLDISQNTIHVFSRDLKYLDRYVSKTRLWDISNLNGNKLLVSEPNIGKVVIHQLEVNLPELSLSKLLEFPIIGMFDTAYNVLALSGENFVAVSLFTNKVQHFNSSGHLFSRNNPFVSEMAASGSGPFGPVPTEILQHQIVLYKNFFCPIAIQNIHQDGKIYCLSTNKSSALELRIPNRAAFFYSSDEIFAGYSVQQNKLYLFGDDEECIEKVS